MIRVTNRQNSLEQQVSMGPQVQFVERIVEVPVISAPEIQYVDREVIKEVRVETQQTQTEPQTIIVQEKVDLKPIQEEMETIKAVINHNVKRTSENLDNLRINSDMQSRALVALKMQRDVDRKRRLTLIRRLRQEEKAHKKTQFKVKLAVVASILISIVSLVVKL